MERLSERAPILVGMTGSRFFDRRDAEADRAAAAAFASRLSGCFAYLDHHFPKSPKALVCGAAFGVDLEAARVALARGRHWSVVALLPFERALFEEDFVPPDGDLDERWTARLAAGADVGGRDAWMAAWSTRYAAHRHAFRALMSEDGGRVLVREMPRLPSRGGARARDDELSRGSPRRDAALRREHYEQVGQWIAESATILFAHTSDLLAVPAEKADGSTARVVACRRIGRPDDPAGLAVAARSDVLRRHWSDVLRSHGRDVWLVQSGPEKGDTADLPVEVLGRRSPFDRRTGLGAFDRESDGDVEEEVGAETRPTPRDTLVAPALIERIHDRLARFEALAAAPSTALWSRLIARAATSRWGRGHDPMVPVATRPSRPRDGIAALRKGLGAVQGRAKHRSEAAFRMLAVLFISGVATFELFADLFPQRQSFLAAYLIVVALGGLIVAGVRRWRWQPMSEDCRSVSEMLRVQDAWWAAGLPDRVDREHLQGVGRDLAHIPETVTTLLAWIWLTSAWPDDLPRRSDGRTDIDWSFLRGTGREPRGNSDTAAGDWIGSQRGYFAKKIPWLDRRACRAQAGCSFVFASAWWLTAILAATFHTRHFDAGLTGTAQDLQRCGVVATFGALLTAGGIAILPLWRRLRSAAIRREIRRADPQRQTSWRTAAAASIPPLVAAIGLALVAVLSVPILADWSTSVAQAPAEGYRWIGLVLVAVLIAVAGAWRFVADKAGYEAEALEYRDAHRRFKLAEYALAEGLDDKGEPSDTPRAQAIVKDLGRLALAENEAWLKSRRERPLTTM